MKKLSSIYANGSTVTKLRQRYCVTGRTFDSHKSPDNSQVEVFRSFSFKFSTVQIQLPDYYKHENFLRDQLLIAVDHLEVQQSLREKVPETSREANNRVVTFLSQAPRSAGEFLSLRNLTVEAMRDTKLWGT